MLKKISINVSVARRHRSKASVRWIMGSWTMVVGGMEKPLSKRSISTE